MTTGWKDVQTRARAAGLAPDWVDVAGRLRRVSSEVLTAVLQRLQPAEAAPAPLLTARVAQPIALADDPHQPAQWCDDAGLQESATRLADGRWKAPAQPGYWTWLQGRRQQRVAVAPDRAWYPSSGLPSRDWGLAAQAYSLRGAADGGIGDSSGCQAWLALLAAHGGAALAISPIHAAMPIGTRHSPYSPSDRHWLEAVHASPMQVLPDAAASVRQSHGQLDQQLRAHEAATRIDWPAAARDKWQWISGLPRWLQQHQPTRWHDIQAQISAAGPSLQAWSEHTARLRATDAGDEAFAQWLARCSWAASHAQARRQGLAIGLIADLAVGFDPAGVEAQRDPGCVLGGLTLGAPPDAFNPNGQGWGLASYAPAALRAKGYAPFIALLRAVMADRGGVRIDHILGLQRLWVMPDGAGPADGVYLQYPFEDLLNLLVLESWRHRCLVIGEDLGVVPSGIRATLAQRGVLGIDVLAFSRDDSGFWPPSRWRADAVAMTSTHDLPPVAGWLQGRDLQWRERLGWGSSADQAQARAERTRQTGQLRSLGKAMAMPGADDLALAMGVVARSPGPLALMPLEDALGLQEQPNLPGTVDEHPNWQQRLRADSDAAALDARLRQFSQQRRYPEDDR